MVGALRLHRASAAPFDPLLFTTTIGITLAALPILYSASYPEGLALHGNPHYFVVRQVAFCLVGLVLLGWASCVDLSWIRRHSTTFLLISGVLVLACFLNRPYNGAHRWLSLFGKVTLQPSEFLKISLIMFLADHLARRPWRESLERDWVAAIRAGLVTGLAAALLFAQPHLSAAVFVVGIGATMVVLGGLNWRRIVLVFGFLALVGVAVLSLAPKYQLARLIAWSGASEPRGLGYHQNQSLKAVVRGGVLGAGFCEGRQKLRYLPAAHNDFIFACIAEEFGLAGVLVALVCFAALIMRCWDIATHCDSQYGSLLCAGVACLLAMQVVAHVGVVLKLLPPTGVTLPLVSAGGSSLVSVLFALGLVLNVSRGADENVEILDYEAGTYRRGYGRPHLSTPRSRRYRPPGRSRY